MPNEADMQKRMLRAKLNNDLQDILKREKLLEEAIALIDMVPEVSRVLTLLRDAGVVVF